MGQKTARENQVLVWLPLMARSCNLVMVWDTATEAVQVALNQWRNIQSLPVSKWNLTAIVS
jgi:hypothetical protein